MHLLDFGVKKVKRSSHDEAKYGKKSTYGILKVMQSNVRNLDTLSSEAIVANLLTVCHRGSCISLFNLVYFTGKMLATC